jgi:hypothetical protein
MARDTNYQFGTKGGKLKFSTGVATLGGSGTVAIPTCGIGYIIAAVATYYGTVGGDLSFPSTLVSTRGAATILLTSASGAGDNAKTVSYIITGH